MEVELWKQSGITIMQKNLQVIIIKNTHVQVEYYTAVVIRGRNRYITCQDLTGSVSWKILCCIHR